MYEKILFITSTRIGDAILSTGLLSHILQLYPTARVTIACGPLVTSLFEGVPRLEAIIPLQKQSWKRHWVKLWAQAVATPWDVVVDLRNSAVSRLIWGGRKYIFGGHINQNVHKVLQNAEVMGLKNAPSTCLFCSPAQNEFARKLIPNGGKVLGVGPTSNWIGKTWPVENFVTLVRELTRVGGPCEGWRVAVFAAPHEESIALKLFEALPKDLRLDLIAKGNPGQAAACLARCDFYIGNDSGLMHCAAAAGIPTLGLFGPTNHVEYAPYGPKAHFIRTPERMDELTGFAGFNPKTLDHTLMGSLKVETVFDQIKGMMKQI